ncbi:LysR substrate-binding domain-containing protein [Sabulicella glaciei]|uniref:LysR substrate-binding domain-containing protein n=1 Tax=Sabulicella glaciei TaxID=2984948 RepID=A0ABT3NZC8_9PROT|nr:LysR substrate-binding domain-containing protein [Roseococcus sp. MDT2-1-1]MCW8087520.1 LysR substrate-binding domain-containing protein [Roseococcus sp. MDT2-1-1]
MQVAHRKLPPLAALRLFEAAGRHGSLRAAAEELGITPSAVSHAMRSLEDSLGVPLLQRDGRGMRLTPAGEELLAEATQAFTGLAATVDRITSARASAGLAVSSAPTFASRWLLPRLPALRRRHPAIALSITTELQPVDIGEGGFDLAIRMAEQPSGPGDWFHLAPEWLLPAVAPKFGSLSLSAALDRLPALHVTGIRTDWARYASARGLTSPDPAKGHRFDTAYLALEAAAKGAGVVLARLPVCLDDLASGHLVALDAAIESGFSYWLVTRPGLLRQKAGRQFADWLREELAASIAQLPGGGTGQISQTADGDPARGKAGRTAQERRGQSALDLMRHGTKASANTHLALPAC